MRCSLDGRTNRMKRSQLRRVSKKHAKELNVYSALRKDYLAAHPTCECQFSLFEDRFVVSAIKCQYVPTQIHHMARRGKNLNNTLTWMAVCRDHHTDIERHATAARKVGLILT